MKNISLYIITLISICFILPAIFTNSTKTVSANETNETNSKPPEQTQNETANTNQTQENTQNNNQEITIKLLHHQTGEIEEVNLETYLYNVVSAEMPATFEKEALKAQAIVARTYTMYKINNKKHENSDICDDSNCCQAWVSKEERLSRWEESKREENWNKITESVNETKGKIITYQNQPINAFFHSNSGGTTEIPVNVWGGSNYPYLQIVQTSGEEGYTQYASEAEYTHEEILQKLKEKYQDIQIDFTKDEQIQILEHTESGRVKTIKFGNHNISGVEARSIFGLKSNNFEIEKPEGKIKFKVKGYGHGVGMSQTGADSLAKQGQTAEQIITHFYSNVEITTI